MCPESLQMEASWSGPRSTLLHAQSFIYILLVFQPEGWLASWQGAGRQNLLGHLFMCSLSPLPASSSSCSPGGGFHISCPQFMLWYNKPVNLCHSGRVSCYYVWRSSCNYLNLLLLMRKISGSRELLSVSVLLAKNVKLKLQWTQARQNWTERFEKCSPSDPVTNAWALWRWQLRGLCNPQLVKNFYFCGPT